MTWYIDIPTRRVVRIFAFALTAGLLLLVAYAAREALSILAVAGFLAIVTHRPVTYIAERLTYGGRKTAATLVFACIGIVAAFIIYLVIPLITTQGQALIGQIPGYVDSLRTGETIFSQWLLQLDIFTHAESLLTSVFQRIVASAEVTISIAGAVIRNTLGILFAVLIGFSLVVEGPRRISAAEQLLTPGPRRHIQELRERIYLAVSGFMNGQLIITTIAATLTFILLTVLGMPAPLSLAAVIWLTGLIPLIGNTLGAVIVLIVALSQSLFVTMLLLVYYVAYQQIENNVFEPIIQSRTVHLTPLTVLISGLIGIMVAGFAGALLAIPAGASLRAMAEYYLEQCRAEPEADKKA